jgi:hypothetical protein
VALGAFVKKELFLDMDGLLTDFQRAMLKSHAEATRKSGLRYENIEWNFWSQLGISKTEFWSVADRKWWEELPWCPEGEALLRNIERIVGRENICLLTSPGVGSMDGKEAWIHHHIPEYDSQFFMGRQKHRVARHGALLVDDSDENCIGFKNAGGKAVLVPRPWNLFKDKMNPDGSYKMRPVLAEIRAWWES